MNGTIEYQEIEILQKQLQIKELELNKREEQIIQRENAIKHKLIEIENIPTIQNMLKVVFVCHTNEIAYEILNDPLKQDCVIFFVGNKEVNNLLMHNKRIIIARNLLHNIEEHNNLLTFTAWYGIIKNELFSNYKYLCILEYDVSLDTNFFDSLMHKCIKQKWDIISFLHFNWGFNLDINEKILKYFLNKKHMNYKYMNDWFPTTNHCFTYSVLKEFVDWYFPDCLLIKKLDPVKISWYHERIFNYFIYIKNYNITKIDGLQHSFTNSHDNLHHKKESLSENMLELYFQNPTCEYLNKIIDNYTLFMNFNKYEEKIKYYHEYDSDKYYKQSLLFKNAKDAKNFLVVENCITDDLLISLLSNPQLKITFFNYDENIDLNIQSTIMAIENDLNIKVKINYIKYNSKTKCDFLKKQNNFDLIKITRKCPFIDDVLIHFNIFQKKIVIILE